MPPVDPIGIHVKPSCASSTGVRPPDQINLSNVSLLVPVPAAQAPIAAAPADPLAYVAAVNPPKADFA